MIHLLNDLHERGLPDRVRVADLLFAVERRYDMGDNLGTTCSGPGIIQIEGRQTKESTINTLIHEIIHIIDYQVCGNVLTEAQVSAIATILGTVQFEWDKEEK